MTPETDCNLLRQFAEHQSERAFAGLVERHVNLVYSVALRQLGNPHQAEEVAQAVFIILARKAGQLRSERALGSWLFQTTRLTANNYLRSEFRRQRREQESCMQSTLNEPAGDAWPHIAPMLDGAVEALGETDRRAIVLRFYEGRNLAEVGHALGASEEAAKKRVTRALEKLRKFFARRGVTLTVAAIAGAVSAHSVQAAPAGLAESVAAVAVAKGAAAGGSTLTLVKGALKIMAWTKAKTVIAGGAAVLLTASVSPYVWHYHLAPDSWRHRLEAAYHLRSGEVLRHVPPPFIPERLTFYRSDNPIQAKYIPAGPDVLVFRQDQQGHLASASYSFGSKQFSLDMVLRIEFDMKPYEFEGPHHLLNLTVNGDWTIKQDLSQAALLKALEPILWKTTRHHIVFEKRTMEREVIVATGDRLAAQPGTAIHLYAGNMRDRGYDGSGNVKTLLESVGGKLGIRLVDETNIDPEASGMKKSWLTWTYHDDCDTSTKDRRDELADKVLGNLARQTGLTFVREQRPVDVWFVTENP